MKTIKQVKITPTATEIDGKVISNADITGLYREYIKDYPKFFKMDSLCRLGIVAAELLLKDLSVDEKENTSIILFNRNGSLITDRNYQKTISEGNYFPSPALFVYTLANIVTGEIAIRHKIYGETSFYVLSGPEWSTIEKMACNVFQTSDPSLVLTGWVDYDDEENYLADIRLITK